jgi:hypothetical protein
MKTVRTYVFMFIPIPSDWLDNERSQSPGIRRCESEPEELSTQLLWTWFVYNPRPLQSYRG